MKLTTISAAVAATFMFAHAAEAREHHHHHGMHREAMRHHHARQYASEGQYSYGVQQDFAGYGNQDVYPERSAYSGRVGGRPSAWCGWEMRQLVGNDPGPSYNLARNWAHWGRSGPAGVGAIVVWAHHVGKIVGQEGGAWVIKSGNDGHAVRTRPRSLAGVIAIRWG